MCMHLFASRDKEEDKKENDVVVIKKTENGYFVETNTGSFVIQIKDKDDIHSRRAAFKELCLELMDCFDCYIVEWARLMD